MDESKQLTFGNYLDRMIAALEAEVGDGLDEAAFDWMNGARERFGDQFEELFTRLHGGYPFPEGVDSRGNRFGGFSPRDGRGGFAPRDGRGGAAPRGGHDGFSPRGGRGSCGDNRGFDTPRDSQKPMKEPQENSDTSDESGIR